MKATLFVLSAASGAGKTTLKDRVIDEFETLSYSISATTRLPRDGEIDGQHYFFKTVEQFKEMIKEDQLIEYMEVHGNFYGTPRAYVEEQLSKGISVILDMDVYGKVTFDKEYPKAVGIFIMPPNMDEMESRLRHRGTDSDEVIQLRLTNAREEIDFAETKGKYEHVLINDDLEKAVIEFKALLSSYIG
ncbi:MAG: guanylate kinase [Fibrobacterales bacterium]